MIDELKHDYKTLQKLKEYKATYDVFVENNFLYRSRSFGITIDGESTQAIVPFADMVNHAYERNAAWYWKEDTFRLYAKKDINKGDTI